MADRSRPKRTTEVYQFKHVVIPNRISRTPELDIFSAKEFKGEYLTWAIGSTSRSKTLTVYHGMLAKGASPRPKLERPPGHALIGTFRFLFSPRVYDAIFVQMIADDRDQHAEALSVNDTRLARWIVIRLHCTLVLAAAAYIYERVGKTLFSFLKLGS